jgi:DNA-directed RNA polymerase sigma subunit (sigma70/sigma32)
MASVIKQPDGTYVATYKDRCRAWPRRQQAKNWVRRQHEKEVNAANHGGERVNRHGVMTYEEVAEIMGMSRARVQQIEKVALRKLRNMLREDGTEKEWFEV